LSRWATVLATIAENRGIFRGNVPNHVKVVVEDTVVVVVEDPSPATIATKRVTCPEIVPKPDVAAAAAAEETATIVANPGTFRAIAPKPEAAVAVEVVTPLNATNAKAMGISRAIVAPSWRSCEQADQVDPCFPHMGRSEEKAQVSFLNKG